MKWLEVEFQGKKHRVPALKHQGRLWFHWLGETHVVDIASGGRKASGERVSTHTGIITAPMPGKITRVTVQKGDEVTKGQALIVMEAMKMEYTLQADKDGVATEVTAILGAQVTLGQCLVRIGD